MDVNYSNLRQLRIEKRLHLQEMAQALGLRTAGGYQRIETGENELKAKHIPAIAEKFEMKIHDLTDQLFFKKKVEQTSTGREVI
ncbi:helix-turn-helix transcriptional regulator [Paenibacillus albicereus]|uniref:Helix-turn-helix transcriptional regulator n=1 Tax=Paenibacillus albicereus TaxID=2726185 RepID=A0A6H2GZS1_9BACL|nr:helix-turn-helix transcriptional regulator [Paenibacillus albicereus]QJC52933.1 helix-turn-helix transcriptional regulator [Paenibacillus albicereus]